MNQELLENYHQVRNGRTGYHQQKRGLIAVWGKESAQFLNGLVTNDVAKLEDGSRMSAAFPNAQGRLLAVVSVLRQGDRFLFETDEITHEKVFNNLFRFTFAGDFFVEDLSEKYGCFSIENGQLIIDNGAVIAFGKNVFVPTNAVEVFQNQLLSAIEITEELYQILRIENGIPLYGIDMDETTIVPELGLDELISYNKGCYIGQEIIARIYFRGHVAKQLRGLVLSGELGENQTLELKTIDDKNAGRLTSVCYSPKLEKHIALGYVRYDYLAEGTEMKIGEITATVKNLPFVS